MNKTTKKATLLVGLGMATALSAHATVHENFNKNNELNVTFAQLMPDATGALQLPDEVLVAIDGALIELDEDFFMAANGNCFGVCRMMQSLPTENQQLNYEFIG